MSLFRRIQEKKHPQAPSKPISNRNFGPLDEEYNENFNPGINVENPQRNYSSEVEVDNYLKNYRTEMDLERDQRNYRPNIDREDEVRNYRPRMDQEKEVRNYRAGMEIEKEIKSYRSELDRVKELRNHLSEIDIENELRKYQHAPEDELRNYLSDSNIENEFRKYLLEKKQEELRKYQPVSENHQARNYRSDIELDNELREYNRSKELKEEHMKNLYAAQLAKQETGATSLLEDRITETYNQQSRSNNNTKGQHEEQLLHKNIETQTMKSLQDLKEQTHQKHTKPKPTEKSKTSTLDEQLKSQLHKKIINEYKSADINEIVDKLDRMVEEIVQEDQSFRGKIDRKKIVTEMVNDLTGFGPINPLLNDPEVSEVMVNGPNQVFAERKGKIQLTDVVFRDNEHVLHIIEKIVAPIGRRIDESSPMVDARLPDGSRVNAIIPPLALNGPTITIRKFSEDPFQIEDLVRFGTLTKEMAIFLDACVKSSLNIFVSGGTGSGKTTTLNVLSSFIPNDERIITIEDAAELQLGQEHVISLETRPPNIEGKGSISIRDLVKNSLRMRPDRIVIGEVRGAEALDMLQAMNTGHDGSLATGHSNSPRDMLSRLETMVLLGGVELPVRAIREQISGAIDLIIQQSRLKDGSRKITNITEVQGLEGDVIVLQDIFVFKQKGVDSKGKIIGKLVPTGVRPKFYERLENSGLYIPPNVFIEEEDYL